MHRHGGFLDTQLNESKVCESRVDPSGRRARFGAFVSRLQCYDARRTRTPVACPTGRSASAHVLGKHVQVAELVVSRLNVSQPWRSAGCVGQFGVELTEQHRHLGERAERIVEVSAPVRLREPLEHRAAQVAQQRAHHRGRRADGVRA